MSRGRPCDLAWIRSIVEQCRKAGVACYVKQLGAHPVNGDARFCHNCYAEVGSDSERCFLCGSGRVKRHIPYRAHKGTDPTEWPEDLRVQEVPR